jgi:hypothetical protein
VIYADGSASGDSAVVEFEDWENTEDARDLDFVWPNGVALDSHEEGYLDDFQFVTPTGSLDFQVAYLTIAEPELGSSGNPKDAIALLINP